MSTTILPPAHAEQPHPSGQVRVRTCLYCHGLLKALRHDNNVLVWVHAVSNAVACAFRAHAGDDAVALPAPVPAKALRRGGRPGTGGRR